MEKREPSYTVGGNVSCCSHYGKYYGGYPRKLKTELTYDPSILLLGVYLNKTIIQKDTFNSIFIAALFTVSKTWKQHKCPSTEEWIKRYGIYRFVNCNKYTILMQDVDNS